jgi:DNA (cytosine-5)-methyltransferase 1
MGDLPAELQHESFVRKGDKKTGGPNLRIIRLEMTRPSLTVTGHIYNKFVHPTEDRYITPREAACLQEFPRDYLFEGTIGEVRQQVGNAVPVGFGRAVALEVAKVLRDAGIDGEVSVASYFCGAGGFDLGFEAAQYRGLTFLTKFCNDIDEASCATIRTNRPTWNARQGDIRAISTEDVVSTIGHPPTVVIGGPPCQPFSVAGKQKGTKDPLGALYRDFVRHVDELRPKVVVMENVYGLAQNKQSNVLLEIHKAFDTIGYKLSCYELCAADYGTPQLRRRLIFYGIEKESSLNMPSKPTATHAADGDLFLPRYTGAGECMVGLPAPHFSS